MLDLSHYQSCNPPVVPPSRLPGDVPILTPSTPLSSLPWDLEQRLRAARPRLLRIVRAMGVPVDAADDVAQETLLAAWRRLDRLRSPERFDAWLDAICRNQCRMYLRANSPVAVRQGGPAVLSATTTTMTRDEDGQTVEAVLDTLPDPQAVNPLEVLDHDDLATFLDRALAYLPLAARTALELRYLAEQSEHEVASSLGVSVNVLEARLHRARRRLRDVITGPLRADAEAFGLLTDTQHAEGWQETRIWCNLCGRRRLHGIFKRHADGKVHLRMRCPDCSERYDVDIYGSKGLVDLEGLRSFRPAITRVMRSLAEQTRQALDTGWGPCLYCGQPVIQRVVGPGEIPDYLPQEPKFWVVTPYRHDGEGSLYSQHGCLSGRGAYTAVEPATWFHPEVQRFMADHPRWITLPERTLDYGGQPAIRFQLADVASAARLTILADLHTLRILATFPE